MINCLLTRFDDTPSCLDLISIISRLSSIVENSGRNLLPESCRRDEESQDGLELILISRMLSIVTDINAFEIIRPLLRTLDFTRNVVLLEDEEALQSTA